MNQVIILKKPRQLKKYYNKKTNTYVFKKRHNTCDIRILFKLEVDADIYAGNIYSESELKANNIIAKYIYAFNLKAQNIQAWNIYIHNELEAKNIYAEYVRANSLTLSDCCKVEYLKCMHIAGNNIDCLHTIDSSNIEVHHIGAGIITTRNITADAIKAHEVVAQTIKANKMLDSDFIMCNTVHAKTIRSNRACVAITEIICKEYHHWTDEPCLIQALNGKVEFKKEKTKKFFR